MATTLDQWVRDANEYVDALIRERDASPKRFFNEADGSARAQLARQELRNLIVKLEPLIVHN